MHLCSTALLSVLERAPAEYSIVVYSFMLLYAVFVAVQSLSGVQLFVTPWSAARQASLCFTAKSLFKLMSIESMMPSHHLLLCFPLLPLPSIFRSI